MRVWPLRSFCGGMALALSAPAWSILRTGQRGQAPFIDIRPGRHGRAGRSIGMEPWEVYALKLGFSAPRKGAFSLWVQDPPGNFRFCW